MFSLMCRHKHSLLLIISVVTVWLPIAHGQSYHFIIGQHQRNLDQIYRESNTRTHVAEANNTELATSDLENNNNSTIIVTTIRERSPELSQTAMDIITIVWYVATFLALAAFFFLMACSDRRCSDTQRNANLQTNETPIPPPTPSPSYSEFAPPSYDSVMKIQHANKTSLFVIPFPGEQHSTDKDDNTNQPPPSTPTINFYTINELQKLGS